MGTFWKLLLPLLSASSFFLWDISSHCKFYNQWDQLEAPTSITSDSRPHRRSITIIIWKLHYRSRTTKQHNIHFSWCTEYAWWVSEIPPLWEKLHYNGFNIRTRQTPIGGPPNTAERMCIKKHRLGYWRCSIYRRRYQDRHEHWQYTFQAESSWKTDEPASVGTSPLLTFV